MQCLSGAKQDTAIRVSVLVKDLTSGNQMCNCTLLNIFLFPTNIPEEMGKFYFLQGNGSSP